MSVISVPVPKDLSRIEKKLAFNLTKRQFGGLLAAAVIGIPVYFLLKKPLGVSVAALLMLIVMLPFIFIALYEKNGFPAEKIFMFIIRQSIIRPRIRPYKSESLYQKIDQRKRLEKEVRYLEGKAKRKRKVPEGNSRGIKTK